MRRSRRRDMETINWGLLILSAAIAYVVGSISFSTIFSRKFRHEDIRTKGSGNAGTANMLRNYGWKLGLATLACDILKGVFGALIGLWLAGPVGMFMGAAFSVIGHCFSIFMKFKGGKGIATGVGAFLVIQPVATLIIFACSLVIVAITRIMSVGSMIGSVLCAIAACILSVSSTYTVWWEAAPNGIWAVWWDVSAIFIAALCLWSHRANMKRLIHGEENKLSSSRRRV